MPESKPIDIAPSIRRSCELYGHDTSRALQAVLRGPIVRQDKSADFTCDQCEDSDYAQACITKDYYFVQGYPAYKEVLRNRNVLFEWASRCRSCQDKAKSNRANLQLIKEADDTLIDIEIIKRYYKGSNLNGLIDLANKIPQKSLLMIGPTGTFKTTIMQIWYNSLVQVMQKGTVVFLQEYDLVRSLQSGDFSIINKLEQIEILFLDDLFLPQDWDNLGKSAYSESMLLYQGLYTFFDVLYQQRKRIQVIASTNRKPKEVIVEEKWQNLLRRISDIFDHGKGYLKMTG